MPVHHRGSGSHLRDGAVVRLRGPEPPPVQEAEGDEERGAQRGHGGAQGDGDVPQENHKGAERRRPGPGCGRFLDSDSGDGATGSLSPPPVAPPAASDETEPPPLVFLPRRVHVSLVNPASPDRQRASGGTQNRVGANTTLYSCMSVFIVMPKIKTQPCSAGV